MTKQGLRPLLAVLLIAGTAPLAHAASLAVVPPARTAYVPVTLTQTQNLRLTLTNLSAPRSGRLSPPDPCKAQVKFFDGAGEQVGDTETVTIEPGASLLLPAVQKTDVNGATETAPLRHLRVEIQSPPDPCRNLHSAVEVYDTRSGSTLFMNPGVIHGFNPQPDPPG